MESLIQIVQQVYPSVEIISTFNNEKHVEFILVKNTSDEHHLIWLPTLLETCMCFYLKYNPEKFIREFQLLPVQSRITYILKNFVDTDYFDIEKKKSLILQNINYHGLHH